MQIYCTPLSHGFEEVAFPVCFQQTGRILNVIACSIPLIAWYIQGYRYFPLFLRPNHPSNTDLRPHCDHFANHPQNKRGNHVQSHRQNPLLPHYQRVYSTRNVSQNGIVPVILVAMRRQKLDPKHVRDFFFDYALSVRIMTLCFDGIWWLISKGFRKATIGIFRKIGNLLPFRFLVNERLRQLHTFIAGKTGTGKSVLLHTFIRHYMTKNRKPSVVLLDPHGDLARIVARDKTNLQQDRLVYIRFDNIMGRFAHFNPFDLANPTEQKLNRAQLQFAGAIEQIIGEPFTPRQRTLIRACLGIMLHRPASNLVDLVRLLQDGQNADLLHYGQEYLPNIIDRRFFIASFNDPNYRATKLALVSRLTDIVRDPVVRRFICHTSTFDLADILNSGKILVVQFDPSKQGRDTIKTIGQLLSAAILSHVLGQTARDRHPIHLHVDECQYFVSPTISEILGESRKFGLYATLATQRIEALDSQLQDAILGNVGNIWVGGSRHLTAEKLSRETNINPGKIRNLPNLQFFHSAASKPITRHSIRYIGNRYGMKQGQWNKLLKHQSKRYYRTKSPELSPLPTKNSKPNWNPDFF